MMRIRETEIEAVLEQLEAHPQQLEVHLTELRTVQPALAEYLFAEHMEAFTHGEQAYFLFLAVVIWKAFTHHHPDAPVLDADAIAQAEERNWELLQQIEERSFRKRLDTFFQQSDEEDLLGFLEDALAEEEEEIPITKEGREPMFVSLKTIADALLANQQTN